MAAIHIENKIIKEPNDLFCGTHRERPKVIAFRVMPIILTVIEIEIGGPVT